MKTKGTIKTKCKCGGIGGHFYGCPVIEAWNTASKESTPANTNWEIELRKVLNESKTFDQMQSRVKAFIADLLARRENEIKKKINKIRDKHFFLYADNHFYFKTDYPIKDHGFIADKICKELDNILSELNPVDRE